MINRVNIKTNITTVVTLLMLFFSSNLCANNITQARLLKGGLVIVMRHAATNTGPKKNSPLVRDPSCKKERMLSIKGKADAKMLGARFAKHKIPVTGVLHSPFCRTSDTAKIAFKKGRVAQYLSLLEILTSTAAAKQTAQLNKVIGSYVGKGNLVLVTHQPNISAIAFDKLGFLDFLVLQPKGGNTYEEVGIVRFTDLIGSKK